MIKNMSLPSKLPVRRQSTLRSINSCSSMSSFTSEASTHNSRGTFQPLPSRTCSNMVSSSKQVKVCAGKSPSQISTTFVRKQHELNCRATSTPKSKSSMLKARNVESRNAVKSLSFNYSESRLHSINDSVKEQVNTFTAEDEYLAYSLGNDVYIDEEVGERMMKSLEADFKVSFSTQVFNWIKKMKDLSCKKRLEQVLAQHFQDIVNSDEFLQFNLELVLVLMQLDDVNINSELEIFNAALKWLTFDWEKRQTYLNLLMGCVRFGLMNDEDCVQCITQLENNDMGQLPICKEPLFHAMIYKMSKRLDKQNLFECFTPQPRTLLFTNENDEQIVANNQGIDACAGDAMSSDAHSAIIYIGGINPFAYKNHYEIGNKIYGLKPVENKWKNVGTILEPRHYAAAAMFQGAIYISGGCDPRVGHYPGGNFMVKDSFWKLDLMQSCWQTLKSMGTPRIHHTLVATCDHLYVFGGQDGRGIPLDLVERYDHDTNTWVVVSPLPVPCLGMAACVYQHNIWICGGIKPAGDSIYHGCIIDTVIVYDPPRNLWHFEAPLRFPRAFANLVVFVGALHIVGGISTITSFNDGIATESSSVDRYYPNIQKWILMGDLGVPRHSSSTVNVGHKMYVIGGVTAGQATDSVECYDASTQKWISDVSALQEPLCGGACLTLTSQ